MVNKEHTDDGPMSGDTVDASAPQAGSPLVDAMVDVAGAPCTRCTSGDVTRYHVTKLAKDELRIERVDLRERFTCTKCRKVTDRLVSQRHVGGLVI